MKNSIIDGQRFTRLTVVEKTQKRKNGYVVWKCMCDCGNVICTTSQRLHNGDTQSCGCLQKEKVKNICKKNFKKYYSNTFVDGTFITKISGKYKNKNNVSGHTGVYYMNSANQWEAKLVFKGKRHKKRFDNKEDAIKYRKMLEEKYFKPLLEEIKLEN